MNRTITIPASIEQKLRLHLFQNELEQAAFLFGHARENPDTLDFVVADLYLVPREGWDLQMEYSLEMSDDERARIMQRARAGGFAIVDCHSHPHTSGAVYFSPSDRVGITEFAQYAKWKLEGRPYAALVWAPNSIDGVFWHGSFSKAEKVDEIRIEGNPDRIFIPEGSWFRKAFQFKKRKW